MYTSPADSPRRPALTVPDLCRKRVALIAAFLGRTRLIDNLEFEIP